MIVKADTTAPAPAPAPATRKGRPRKYDRAGLISNLTELYERDGRAPGAKELNVRDGRPSLQAYLTEFGSLNAAKEAAGLPTRHRGRPIKGDESDVGREFATVTEAALHVLAGGPKTATEVARRVEKLTKIQSKDHRKSVQEALHRSPKVKQTGDRYSLA